jgi:hypothetical protein
VCFLILQPLCSFFTFHIDFFGHNCTIYHVNQLQYVGVMQVSLEGASLVSGVVV